METSNSVANHAVFHAQINRRSLGPMETCNSVPKVVVLHAKTIGVVWEPMRLVILLLKSPFLMQKPQMKAGTHRD